jgi:tetratricopeptide (TPR) repeat protein/Zn finger protein HypA/HybF involved in hydrogenase expression
MGYEKGTWFDMGAMVYKDQEIKPDNWLYWTNQAQNWNGMCAECHSTNLKKNYIAELDSFHTSWSEINVSCEACHGPGSEHIKWAGWPENRQEEAENFGLVVQTSGINNEQYVNLCARCHARRSQLGDYDHTHSEVMDFMIPTLLHDDYFADGQILDEDYVWGSFIQSKMYHTDIKCNDCHNVHSGERLFEGNRLCFECHQQDYYGTAKHHFHKTENDPQTDYFIEGRKTETGEGANCVNCHMPGRYYMGNDFRNDHSIRIPRPDLSNLIDVPNACNQCHTDKSVNWAIRYTEDWYGKKTPPHYGPVLAGGRVGKPETLPELIALVMEDLNPLIVRATALELLANYSDSTASNTIRKMLDAPEAMLRFSATRIYSSNDATEYISDIGPLLTDPARAVRLEAGLRFSYLPSELIPENYKSKFEAALKEFEEQNTYMADFPGGRANLGLMHSNLGNFNEAIKHYKRATEIDNQFHPAFVNMALAYNQTGQNTESERIYKHLIEINAELPGIYYSLGLLQVEMQKYDEAIENLQMASLKDPMNSRINYNLGLLHLQLSNNGEAEKQLKKAIEKESGNFDYQYALAHFYVTSSQFNKAKRQLSTLKKQFPNDVNVQQLNNFLLNQTN